MLRRVKFFFGLALFVFLTLFWLYYVNQAENSNYLLQIFKKDLLPKLQGGHESHGKPPLFHLFILPLTFWPASLLLWPAALFARKNFSNPVVKFLLAWILPTWLFFELMPTKLPQYLLPIFPALAILSALALEKGTVFKGRGMTVLQILWALLSFCLGLGSLVISYLILNKISWIAVILCLEIIFFTAIILYHGLKHSTVELSLLFALAFLSYFLGFELFLPSLKPLWISKETAIEVSKYKTSKENPLIVAGFDEPSLVFNLDTYAVKFSSPMAAISTLAQGLQGLALIEGKALPYENLPPEIQILNRFNGFNYSKGKWVNLILIGKNIRSLESNAKI